MEFGVKNMLVKNAAENRGQVEFVSLEEMVPKDHLLRKIDAAVNFKRIYEFVEDLYCEGQRQTKRRPGGAVQNRADPAYLRDPFAPPNSGRGEHEPGIPLVHRISAQRSGAAFLHGELQLQAPVQSRHGGVYSGGC